MAAVRLVTGLSDSYKAKQIFQMVQGGTRFTHDEVRMMINSASDSYKRNMLASCKGSVSTIPQHCFKAMLSEMNDSYKASFSVEYLSFMTNIITSSTLIACLTNISDSYKNGFIMVLLPRSEKISSATLITMLDGMSDSYKSAFIVTCTNYLESKLNGTDMYNILKSCSDSYKANIVRSLGDKLALESYDDIFVILDDTSDSYKSGLTSVLNVCVGRWSEPSKTVKTSKEDAQWKVDTINSTDTILTAMNKLQGNINANITCDNVCDNVCDSMSDNMLRFMTDSVQSAVQAAVSSILCTSRPEAVTPSEESKLSKNPDCVICLDAPAGWLIVPCGHKCCCESCGNTITSCPICRGTKTQLVKVFGE